MGDSIKSEVALLHNYYKVDVKDKRGYLIFKRIIDIIGSIIAIILLSIIFIIVGILIKMEDSKGSIFFSQTRIGKNGRKFKIYKFRSMVSNAEERLQELLEFNEINGAMFKMKGDPRITKVGKFIRKTSLDELPQLWNVLKGDMSLVGPRPPLPSEVEKYTEYDKQRLLIIPGCTGLWQVNGRNNIGFDEMVKLDLSYIEDRNILMDIKIILKTILVLFGSKSAY